MARPKVDVRHFLLCRSAPWEGIPGSRTPRTLEGVSHYHAVPPGTELPLEIDELWTDLRVFNMNSGDGRVAFYLSLYWLDSPTGSRRLWTRPYARIPFRSSRGVVEAAYSVGPLRIPGTGWYEFRLLREVRLRWKTRRLIVARELLLIE